MRTILIVVAAVSAALPLRAQQPPQVVHQIGSVHFPTSCNPGVEQTFDRAVALLHSFAFASAVGDFNIVLRDDPRCAMAYWGVALSAWGNPFAAGIKPPAQIQRGLAAITGARAAGTTTDRERAYIEAAAHLYEHTDSLSQPQRSLAYRDAMAAVAARMPPDTEAVIFHALAQAFSADPTDKTYSNQLAAGATLERLFAVLPHHPGLAHYIIHAYDLAPLASRALNAAHSYSQIAPEVSHALHMPSHTYTRVGAWQESIDANVVAAAAARHEESTAEELHASDYRTYAYLQTGQDRAAARLVADVPMIARRLDPTAITTGGAPAAGYYAIAAIPARYALERGAWGEAAHLELHPSPVPFADAVTWFARALGSARIGDTVAAKNNATMLELLRDSLATLREKYWSEQVEIQRRGAVAWLDFAAGRKAEALSEMKAAADREDATEKNAITPGPIAPAREMLGDMLLQVHEPARALAAFEATLSREPNRFRTMAGAAKAASEMGNKTAANKYRAQMRRLTARGDQHDRLR